EPNRIGLGGSLGSGGDCTCNKHHWAELIASPDSLKLGARKMKRQPKSFENVETGTDPFHSDPSVVIDSHILELFYGTFRAVRDTAVPVVKNAITALIGPSGCGKSTVLRCFNRMNDLVRGFRFTGHVRYRGRDIYDPAIDAVAVRRYIGMVFQQPN